MSEYAGREKVTVFRAKYLSTGYVRFQSEHASKCWGWGQMPTDEFDNLKPGERIPDEYIFQNECPGAMPIMIMPTLIEKVRRETYRKDSWPIKRQ